MTFVFCKVQGPRIFILADTRISQNGSKLPPERGIIKTTLLSPQVAISFAQSPELAARDINQFGGQYKGKFRYSDAVDFFEKSSTATNNDYILAFLSPLRLVKIGNGRAVKSIANLAWIGEYEAFHRFREYESGQKKGPDLWQNDVWAPPLANKKANKQFSNILTAFQLTLANSPTVSVGDFYTVVTNDGSEFKFMIFAKMYFDSLGPNPITPTFGENVDYRFSTMAPKESGINACAFYYPHASKGFVFYSMAAREVADQCRIISDKSLDAFIVECRTAMGIEFDYVTVAHTKPMGEK